MSASKTSGRAAMGHRDGSVMRHTVESLGEEIARIVAERQELRSAGADAALLEENRRRLAAAQNRLSLLLIERHLPRPSAA